MTASGVKLLHQVIAEAAIPAGFGKKGSSWYCDEPDCILVINPQKSQYSSRCFVNLGIYWRKLGDKTVPREEECHVRGRISSAVPAEESNQLEQSLDFEDSSIDAVARRTAVRDALSRHAIPLLKRCSTAEGLRREMQKSTLRRFVVARNLALMIDL